MELQCSVIVMYIVGNYYQSGLNYNSKLSHGLLVVRVPDWRLIVQADTLLSIPSCHELA